MLSAQFVATLDPAAEIRLALHDPDQGTYVQDEALTITPADFLGSPGGVGGDAGYLRLTIGVIVHGDAWAARRFFSSLSRELLRPENYLRLQLDEETPPQWYHTWRTTPGPPDIAAIEAGVWLVTVQVDADPYVVGEQITTTVTVTNDPATGGMSVVLPDIMGDAPAPLLVEMAAGDLSAPFLATSAIEGVEWPGVQVKNPETLTTQHATITFIDDTTASGGRRIKLAWASDADLTMSGSTSMTPVYAGTYRVFARVRMIPPGGGADVALINLTPGGSARKETGQAIAVTGLGWQILDLGVYVFPKGNMPLSRPYTIGPGQVMITATRPPSLASAPGFNLDYLVAVPVELVESVNPATWLDFPVTNITPGMYSWRIDGERGVVTLVTEDDVYNLLPVQQPAGRFLEVTPGATNVLHVFPRSLTLTDTGVLRGNDVLTESTELTLTYRPNFLYFADA